MFALHILEEGGLRGEKAILQFLLQAAVPTAHAAVHRHLARSRDAASASAGRRDAGGRPGPSPGSAVGAGARARQLPRQADGRRPPRVRTLGPVWLARQGNLFPSQCAASSREHEHGWDLPRSPAPRASAVSRPRRRLPPSTQRAERHRDTSPASSSLSCPWYSQSSSQATSSRKVPQSPAGLSRRPSLSSCPSPAPLHSTGCPGPGGQWTSDTTGQTQEAGKEQTRIHLRGEIPCPLHPPANSSFSSRVIAHVRCVECAIRSTRPPSLPASTSSPHPLIP